jgi:hypothetical protein
VQQFDFAGFPGNRNSRQRRADISRSLNRRNAPSWGDCSFQLISPPMKFPPLAVIGGSSAPTVENPAKHTKPILNKGDCSLRDVGADNIRPPL